MNADTLSRIEVHTKELKELSLTAHFSLRSESIRSDANYAISHYVHQPTLLVKTLTYFTKLIHKILRKQITEKLLNCYNNQIEMNFGKFYQTVHKTEQIFPNKTRIHVQIGRDNAARKTNNFFKNFISLKIEHALFLNSVKM